MSVIAMPPGSGGKPDDLAPGDSWYVCNADEWIASTLARGDRCWFRHRLNKFAIEPVLSRWKAGTFKSAWMYDGVIANVIEDDPDEYIEHTLFLDLGDKIERWGAHPDSWRISPRDTPRSAPGADAADPAR